MKTTLKTKSEEKEEKGSATATLESIKAETGLIKAQIELDEIKHLRDLPGVLLEKEKELSAKEIELTEKEDLLAGKESRLADQEQGIRTKESALVSRINHAEKDIQRRITSLAIIKQEQDKALAIITRYIDFARLSQLCDVEQRFRNNDLEDLQWAINAIKKWRNWK